MSEKRFIQMLQALLTMVDPDNPTSVACVKATLENIFALATESKKANGHTIHMIHRAVLSIDHLIMCRDDFAGRPGDYNGNVAKQKRLANVLQPGC